MNKRIPFDGSDAFNLTLQKFKPINDDIGETFICVRATNKLVFIGNDICISYNELAKNWLKWNELIKEWQPCNKIA